MCPEEAQNVELIPEGVGPGKSWPLLRPEGSASCTGDMRQVNTAMGREDFHVGLWMPQGGREAGRNCYTMPFTSACCTSPWPGPTLETGVQVPKWDKVVPRAEAKSSTTPIPVKTGVGWGLGGDRLFSGYNGGAHFPWKGQWEQHPKLERDSPSASPQGQKPD